METKVVIYTTGGTIESKKIPGVGLKPAPNGLSTEKISDLEIPLFKICELDSTDINDNIRNEKIGPTIEKTLIEGYSTVMTQPDIILYHGTDTLADTSGVLDSNFFGVKGRIVITGALYSPESFGSDAEKNKKDAVFFTINGKEFSGVYVVMGGNVLSPFLWGRHYWRPHDPVIELIRLSDSMGFLAKSGIELHEPFNPIAKIEGNKFVEEKYMSPTDLYGLYSTYMSADSEFKISTGSEGKVQGLNFRGEEPYSGKIVEFNQIIKTYSELKEKAINEPDLKNKALSQVENLFRKLEIDPKIFTEYWKDLRPKFDKRTNLKEIFVVGDQSSNPKGYLYGIKNGIWAGIVIRGVGYGHVHLTDEWKEVLKAASSYNVPVSIVTDEGIITSNQYAVSKPLYELSVNSSGTLNAKETQIKMATNVGSKEKRKFINEVAVIFNVKPLTIDSVFNVSGNIFENCSERRDWESVYKYSTNPDIAYAKTFKWEEKILFSALNASYVSGNLKRISYPLKNHEYGII